MIFKKVLLILGLICVFFLTGCSHIAPLNQRLIIRGIGIDVKDSKYLLTIQSLNFQDANEKKEPSTKVLQLEGDSIMEALDNAYKETGFEPLYAQNLVIVIGKEVAESGINKIIDFFVRHYETRLNVKICMTKGRASEILNLKSDEKIIEAQNIDDIIDKNLNSDLIHFANNTVNNISDTYMSCININENNGNKKIIFDGIAIFSDNKLVKILEGENFNSILLMKGVNHVDYVLNIEKFGNITAKVNQTSMDIRPSLIDNIPNFEIFITAKIDIFEIENNPNISLETSMQIIKQKFEHIIKVNCDNVLKELISSNLDIFNFGKIILKSYPNYFRQNYKKSLIKEISYNITVNVDINSFGREKIF